MRVANKKLQHKKYERGIDLYELGEQFYELYRIMS